MATIPRDTARPPMPQILSLYETHPTVADLHRSIGFYRDIIGLEPVTELRR
jgi:lactoylglutathione lyase